MSGGRLVFEAAGSASRGATAGTIAAVAAGETDAELDAPLTAPRTCYGCAGTGKRGVFDCGVCAGAGKLTGPPARAHADSFRRGALRLPGPERAGAAKRTPVIRTRRRRRRPEPRDSDE